MSEALEYRIAKLELKSGDLVVLKFDRPVTFDGITRAREEIKPLLPPGVKAMILDRDVDLSVLTADEIQRRAT